MKINTDDCMSCGMCSDYCSTGAIQLKESDGKGYGQYYIDENICVDCKECLEAGCPADAIIEGD